MALFIYGSADETKENRPRKKESIEVLLLLISESWPIIFNLRRKAVDCKEMENAPSQIIHKEEKVYYRPLYR